MGLRAREVCLREIGPVSDLAVVKFYFIREILLTGSRAQRL